MNTPETWLRADALIWAVAYAQSHGETLDRVKRDEQARDWLRRWLELNDEERLVDGETGMGVELGPPATTSTWDVRSMPDALVLSLARRGLLTVSTAAFEALRKAGDGADLLDAERYRIRGERGRPLRVIP